MATIGMLATGVAHEVNNPLTAISGFTEGLKRRLPAMHKTVDPAVMEDVDDYVNTILRECRRCQDIVATLLTFSTPRAESFSEVSLNAVVLDTLKLLRSHIKQRQAKITVRVDLCEQLPKVRGDEKQIKQVMLNLFINANGRHRRTRPHRGQHLPLRTGDGLPARGRLGLRHSQRAHGQVVRAVFHHQAGGQGHGDRAIHLHVHRP